MGKQVMYHAGVPAGGYAFFFFQLPECAFLARVRTGVRRRVRVRGIGMCRHKCV